MQKQNWFRLLALVAVLALMLATAEVGIADAGDFSGDTDWGGSDWDSGSDWSSSDWDSSDWSSSSSDSSWFSSGSTWSSSNDDSYDSSDKDDLGSGFGDFIFDVIGFLVICFVVYSIIKGRKNKSSGTNVYNAEPETPGLSIDELKKKDPNFNEQKLLELVRNNYIKMQQAWEAKDWEPMRAVMTDALYNQMGLQLEGLKKRGWTNHVERIAVLDANIRKYCVEEDNDVLVVRVKSRITDYTVDDKTGNVVKGSKTNELFMTYDWKLVRNKDRKTLDVEELKTVSCPHCGAPLSVNQSARCAYCGTVITLSDHDWALSSIKGISQVTGKK